MTEDGSGKRSTAGAPADGNAASVPSPGARATPTALLRQLVGSRPPMAVRVDEVAPPGAAAASAPAPSDPSASDLAARPTEPGFAPPEPPPRAPTSVRPAFVSSSEGSSSPAAAPDNVRGRLAPSDAPFAASLIERPKLPFRASGTLLAFVASVLAGVLLVLAFRSGEGALMVTAGGSRNVPLAVASVRLDGKVVCRNVPCRIQGVAAGEHAVLVEARGYRAPLERRVTIESGKELASHFTLEPEATASIDVRIDAPGLRIYVDGQDRGPAPGRVTGLAATTHLIELSGSPLFAPFELRVQLGAGDVKLVQPTLTLLRGAVLLRAGKGAKDANVYLEREGERRRVPSLPARIEVAPLGGYRVVATKRGFTDFERVLAFSIGKPELDVSIELERKDGEAWSDGESPDAALDEPAPSAPSLLTLESTPSCNIVLDGRPIGKTPQTVPVEPGSHSVLFVHPTLGRKSVTVRAKSGEPSSASVRF